MKQKFKLTLTVVKIAAYYITLEVGKYLFNTSSDIGLVAGIILIIGGVWMIVDTLREVYKDCVIYFKKRKKS